METVKRLDPEILKNNFYRLWVNSNSTGSILRTNSYDYGRCEYCRCYAMEFDAGSDVCCYYFIKGNSLSCTIRLFISGVEIVGINQWVDEMEFIYSAFLGYI